MAVTYDALMALDVPPVVQRYDASDAILYALGIGFGTDPLDERQLAFVYGPDLRAVPTLALVLAIPPDWVRRSGLDYARVVHGEQSVAWHAPLPVAGEVRGTLRITDVIDKGEGRGALVYAERTISDAADGTLLATIRQTIFARGDGGVGGPRSAQPPAHVLPTRTPDGSVTLPTLPQQALLYRLSGDWNPLHADPALARKVGFERPILHGLATFGVATHALLAAACDYEPARLRAIEGRFTAPVYPGEALTTDYWIDAGEVSFRTHVVGRDAVAIGGGRATLA